MKRASPRVLRAIATARCDISVMDEAINEWAAQKVRELLLRLAALTARGVKL